MSGSLRRTAAALLIGAGIVLPARGSTQPPAEPEEEGPALLPPAPVRDVDAKGRLFARGIPVTEEAVSPDNFHFAYLHTIPGGFLRRKPRPCTFLLDLSTGENRPVKTPKGRAARVGGWDSTGRYLLIESHDPDLLMSLTGGWTTYHWIFDVVTSEFPPRKPFSGRQDGRRFRWKQRGTYHGLWDDGVEATIVPLYEGALADLYHARENGFEDEDRRRRASAEVLALASAGEPLQVLADLLPRLDETWMRRSQRDPVVSELFGHRPTLWVLRGGEWKETFSEVDYVAVLDRGLTLVTRSHGRQVVLDPERWEAVPLPAAPEGWSEALDARWTREPGFYNETDPLPRDLQYRRSTDVAGGTGYYYNYVLPDRSRLLVLYSFESSHRVLRIVDLPPRWHAEYGGH